MRPPRGLVGRATRARAAPLLPALLAGVLCAVPSGPVSAGQSAIEAAGAPAPGPAAPGGTEWATAAPHSEVFVAANAAYDAGEHDRAVELYRLLVERGEASGWTHYNLGNAHLRRGELGLAIASYLRAQRDLPRHRDVQANLRFARGSAKDAIEPPGRSELSEILFFWHGRLGRGEKAFWLIALHLLLWASAALWLRNRRAPLLWIAAGALLGVTALGGSLLVDRLWPLEVAVIVPPEVAARSAVGTAGVVLFRLHAGSELEVTGRAGDFLRVRLPGGEEGWIEASHAAVVAR